MLQSSVIPPPVKPEQAMDYDQLLHLRKSHTTWRLLVADNAPMILGFFDYAFIRQNRRQIAQPELLSLLDDYLFQLRERHGDGLYPKAAKDYLEDWARGEQAFLRKYYPRQSDEPEFDLTPGAEKALEWLQSLKARQFVGTESRLQTIYQLLRELVQQTETDPQARIAELERQKASLDEEIARLQQGAALSYDATQVKERFIQIEDTARHLLADFRQVEENFRQLDQATREKIAVSNQRKGGLLDEIFCDQDTISDSDQGKSFRAFWAYLMSPDRQQEMAELVERILALEPIDALEPDEFLRQLRFQLLDAGEKVQRTSASLIEQLRRYLDDQVWLENKRIMGLVGDIERLAVGLRHSPPADRLFTTVDDARAAIELPLSRGLFRPPQPVAFEETAAEEGRAEFDSQALYSQQYVDLTRLNRNIRRAVQRAGQLSLEQLVDEYPLEQGLSELVAYLNIASQSDKALIDDSSRQILRWQTEAGQIRQATLPLVIFTK